MAEPRKGRDLLDPRRRFLDALRRSLDEHSLAKLTLGAPCGPDASLRNVHGRLVELKAGPRVQLLYRHSTRDVTKNMAFDEAISAVCDLIGASFRTAHL